MYYINKYIKVKYKKMDMQNKYTESISEFNDAFGTSARFAGLFSIINQASLTLDIYLWYRTLRRFRQELISDMKEDISIEIKQLLDNIEPEIILYQRKKENPNNKGIPAKICNKLEEIEEKLRKVHDSAGYKTRREYDPGSAIGQSG